MGHKDGGVARGALAMRSLDDMLRFAEQVVKGKLCPPADTAATVAVKLQGGAELGFSPVQSLSVLTVINGRLGIMGVGALARLRSSGQLAAPVKMGVDGDGDDRRGWIETRRKGEADWSRSEFAVKDAKRAGLWGKSGPWTQYPDDMLQWRAVGRHAKRHWSDVLLGVDIAETIEVHPVTPRPMASGPDPLFDGSNSGELGASGSASSSSGTSPINSDGAAGANPAVVEGPLSQSGGGPESSGASSGDVAPVANAPQPPGANPGPSTFVGAITQVEELSFKDKSGKPKPYWRIYAEDGEASFNGATFSTTACESARRLMDSAEPSMIRYETGPKGNRVTSVDSIKDEVPI